MKKPKVEHVDISIIISTLNAQSCLSNCLHSIRRQTVKPEVIIIDGGSTDATLEIIEKNSDVVDFYLSEGDTGIYDAWNKGLKHVSHSWVYFLGADDSLYADNVLAEVDPLLAKLPKNQLLAYGKVCFVDESGRYSLKGEPWRKVARSFLYSMCIPHQGVFHRKELFKKHGLFDLSFKIAGDYALIIKEILDNPPHFLQVPPVAFMKAGGVSTQGDKSWKVYLEFARASFQYWTLKSSLSWCYFFSRACIKRFLLILRV